MDCKACRVRNIHENPATIHDRTPHRSRDQEIQKRKGLSCCFQSGNKDRFLNPPAAKGSQKIQPKPLATNNECGRGLPGIELGHREKTHLKRFKDPGNIRTRTWKGDTQGRLGSIIDILGPYRSPDPSDA
jgi:hypothetical protein